MSFIRYIKENHPDPDTLLGKNVSEAMEEINNLVSVYTKECINESLKETCMECGEEIIAEFCCHDCL